MSVVSQLYQLQEVDLELESNEQALERIAGQIGESQAVVSTRNKITREEEGLEELKRQQQSVEWEIDDITGKLTSVEEELYSGRIGSPKELTSLQQEIEALKAKRNQLEDRALEIMDRVELATKGIAKLNGELKQLEAEWQSQQQKLSAQLEQVKSTLSDLEQKRQVLAGGIDSQVIKVYQQLKKQKGTAVARVEQGVCRGCRISLPVSELQSTRSGNLVRCGSCGRILFLA